MVHVVSGHMLKEYDPSPINEYVSGAVFYKDNPYFVTLSHLAGGWEDPDGSMAEATLQSCYDGAALVYIWGQALSLIGKPEPPGHAEVRIFITDGTSIKLYTHYAALSKDDGMLEYHQYQYVGKYK
ncbi:putative heterokaryon incompatibility protein [Rosellinia necatrix]|uniref:Putative heterokaryon incompatibility protein n=1 Tax=Rosellinia necatrix TaxID=77044 RepID=A0A1W2TU87_ROSNE|nr:putative heterokaryon incompatibility protein [Rosellinia necatrix]